MALIDKPRQEQSFATFDDYRLFLRDTLDSLWKNMSAESRNEGYRPLSSCSSGYDSTAVSVLAREIGTLDAVCVPQDRLGLDDSGIELVKQLDMEPRIVERFDWRKQDFAEIPFIAGDACGRDTWLQPASELLANRVFLTGNFGDAAWSERPPNRYGRLLRSEETGPAGLSLTEFRLHAGFIHCPLPYLGAETLRASAIRNSEAMQPWRRGNRYDRPIPRRIVEQAGIERFRFGTRKTATAVHLFRRTEFDRFFAGTESLRDYMRWIRRHSRQQPPPSGSDYPLNVPSLEEIEVPLFRHLFPWAIERCKQAYRCERPLESQV